LWILRHDHSSLLFLVSLSGWGLPSKGHDAPLRSPAPASENPLKAKFAEFTFQRLYEKYKERWVFGSTKHQNRAL
jgi:hypothetical protein